MTSITISNDFQQIHSFHIPVMGIGHSADTPIRMAPLGISSVISLVDDLLLEKLREFYCGQFKLPYVRISKNEDDGRAKRISAYLDLVYDLVHKKFEEIRKQPFFQNNEKKSYFEYLKDSHPLKVDYLRLQKMAKGPNWDLMAQSLEGRMIPGSIDVNIMVKLDRIPFDKSNQQVNEEFSDAKTALRGFAMSKVNSSVIFSAGMNPKLFTYVSKFKEFYRDTYGQIRKRIILKVSDFRSALIQSRFLAKRGLEVFEYRIESGLNCGGHAFPTRGQLLPVILQEFKEKWHELTESVVPLVQEYYEKMILPQSEPVAKMKPRLTVQGGIGTDGEVQRLIHEFNVDSTGWGSPFLLVPEATTVDDSTRELLTKSTESDLYLSGHSPLRVPFNTVRGTGSEMWTRRRIENGIPGSGCPKGFAISDTEFSEKPLCLASRQYQSKKLEQINQLDISENEREMLRKDVTDKMCICDHLGNGILIKLGLAEESQKPQAICPGPNIAWFNRTYTLKEMVDHIYGRGACLVPAHRPHVFAKELMMNVDYFETVIRDSKKSPRGHEDVLEYKQNLEAGLKTCLQISKKNPFPNENLASLKSTVNEQYSRLAQIWGKYISEKEMAECEKV